MKRHIVLLISFRLCYYKAPTEMTWMVQQLPNAICYNLISYKERKNDFQICFGVNWGRLNT